MADYQTSQGWGTSTWLVVAGGAIALIVILALFSGGTATDGGLQPATGDSGIAPAAEPAAEPTSQ